MLRRPTSIRTSGAPRVRPSTTGRVQQLTMLFWATGAASLRLVKARLEVALSIYWRGKMDTAQQYQVGMVVGKRILQEGVHTREIAFWTRRAHALQMRICKPC